MLQKADITEERWHGSEPVSREPAEEPSLQVLMARLAQLGFDLPALFSLLDHPTTVEVVYV